MREVHTTEERDDEPLNNEQSPFESLGKPKRWSDGQREPVREEAQLDPIEVTSSALLPEELIELPSRSLAELTKGERGYVNFAELVVMSDRRCFLNLRAELRPKNSSTVQVAVDDDEFIHVVIPSDTTYQPGRLSARRDAKLVPVASITIGPPAIR